MVHKENTNELTGHKKLDNPRMYFLEVILHPFVAGIPPRVRIKRQTFVREWAVISRIKDEGSGCSRTRKLLM